MHNIFLIARREYLERIRTKGFLIMTVLIPLLMGGGFIGSVLMSKNAKSDSRIVVVSYDLPLAEDLQKELQNGENSAMTVNIIAPPSANTRPSLDRELQSKSIDGYLWIRSPEHASGRPAVEYKPRSSADLSTRERLQGALHSVLMREQLQHQGMAAQDVNALMQPVQMNSSATGDADSTTANYVGVIVLFLLMYFVIMLYGMNVARSIIEEKTSRVFEVMLATIRPSELLAGKMLGVGSVGLTQVAVWLAAGFILSSTSLIAHYMGSGAHVHLSPTQIIFFVVFFLLGYMLYSSMAAALGAMTNSEQELQQLNMFLVLPLALCMFSLGAVVNSPDGKLATVMSLIPFCTPLLMYMRISLGHPSVLQVVTSIVLMIVTIYAVLWIASRIYRVGILMYGKRPTLPEIMRWLKYS